MFIAHMPSGYIVAKLVFRQLRKQPVVWKIFLICALIGSVAPDFDLIYFYLWDHKQHHHHTYWPHYPIVWLSLLLINFLLLGLLPGLRKTLLYSAVFLFCGSIHLLLDTVVGDIWWLMPFVDKPFAFASVPRLVEPWWLNFFIHWSFLLEILTIVWAVCLWRKPAKRLSVSH